MSCVKIVPGEGDAAAETAGAVPIAIYQNGNSQSAIALWSVTVVKRLGGSCSVLNKSHTLRKSAILVLTRGISGESGMPLCLDSYVTTYDNPFKLIDDHPPSYEAPSA